MPMRASLATTGLAASLATACGASPPAPPHNVATDTGGTWIHRHLATGAILRESSVETYRLVRDGALATLTVTRRTAPHGRESFPAAIEAWRDDTETVYTGAATSRDGELVFSLASGALRLELRCTRASQRVAIASAVRTPTPGETAECGDTGAWAPAETLRIEALACLNQPPGGGGPPGFAMVFGEAPGIEWLFVNDDCVMQGGGLRAIPPDGSIARVRAAPAAQPL